MASLQAWRAEIINPAGRVNPMDYQRLDTTAGREYTLAAVVSNDLPRGPLRGPLVSAAARSKAQIRVGTTPGASDIFASNSLVNARPVTTNFIATAQVAYISLVAETDVPDGFVVFANVTVTEL